MGSAAWGQTADPAPSLQGRLFEHNASTMRVAVDGARVRIVYHSPDPRFRLIRAGDVLFEGRIVGQSLVGFATLYSDRCPPARYEVRGDLRSLGQNWFRLEGPVPVRDGRCNIRRFDHRSANASLVFLASGPAGENRAVAGARSPGAATSAQAATQAANPLVGTWTGQYACGSDQGGMQISIEEAGGRLVATEQFSRGGYRHTLRHVVDVLSANRIVVRPQRGAVAPKEFQFDGRNTLNGRIVGYPQCRPLALSRASSPTGGPALAAARFEPHSVRVGTVDARIVVASSSCAATMTVRVEASEVRLFANRQALMAEVKPHIVNQLTARCPTVQTVAIEGLVQSRRVYQADMGRGSDWMLAARQTPLDDAIERLKLVPDDLQSLGRIRELNEAAVRDFGGPDTDDARELARAVALRFEAVARSRLPEFAALVAGLDASPESLARIDGELAATVRNVESITGEQPSEYRRLLDERRAAIRSSIVAGVARDLGGEPPTWENAHKVLDTARAIADRYRESIPEASALALAARQSLETALREKLPAFVQDLSGEPATFATAAKLSAQAVPLAVQAAQFPQLWPYLDAVTSRRREVLTKLVEEARREIAGAGRGLGDIAAVMDLAAERESQFRTAGDIGQGDGLRGAALDRIRVIAAENVDAFAARLRAIGPDRAGQRQLDRLRQDYAQLAGSLPAFEAYRQVIELQADHLTQQACRTAQQRFGQRPQDLDRMVVAGTAMSLGDLICRIDRADGALVSPGGGIVSSLTGLFRADIVVEHRAADGTESSLTLRPSPTAGDAGALIGVQRESAGRTEPLSREDWLSFVERAVRPRPTGLPVAGVTECDMLAGDPDDPRKVAAGVRLETIDTERAVEACIAAREIDPRSARLTFQLGRSLEAVGLADDARRYYEAAARQGHAAAHAALGAQLSLSEQPGDDAIAHYERAVAQGYSAARDILAMLKAPRLIDFGNGWPERGRIQLSCMALEEVAGQGGQNEHADNWEFVLSLDFDGKTASVSNDLSWQAFELFHPGRGYRLTVEDGNIVIASAGGRFVLAGKTLSVTHRSNLTLAGRPIILSVNGHCHQNLRQVQR